MLMQAHENLMVSGLMFAAGGHLCQTASTLIPGVASMPDQGENKKSSCIAFLLSVNNANLGLFYKGCAEWLMALYAQQQYFSHLQWGCACILRNSVAPLSLCRAEL